MLSLLPFFTNATAQIKKEEKKKFRLEQLATALPDSAFQSIRKEDLLQDEVYIKLARDGWQPNEITRIMNNYLKSNRSRVRGSVEYGQYAKQWLPTYGFTPGNDSIYGYVDTTYNEKAIESVRSLFGQRMTTWDPEIVYTPDDRIQGIRRPGYFRPVQQKPYTGRIHWIVVHPTDPDALMVVPDGAGIFRTDDLGRTWDCVTDRIPDREFRKICSHSAIPVDPDDWNHFFAFMKNGNATAVYETTDGGQNWTRIAGATHKSFKRGYGFKDKAGRLKFVGALQKGTNYLSSEIWWSDDKGVSWKQIVLPEELRETHPETGMTGSFFQNFAFDPENRDRIYFTTSRSIYYSDNGLTPQIGDDGTSSFDIKRLTFNVLNQDGTEVRATGVSEFPFKGTTQSFFEINPNNPQQMWFATASRNVSYGVYSAVYYSEDGGQNWRTLQEPMNGIGSGLAFGNESPWGWLGGFAVNFQDPQWLYGCSMSSAISSDAGLTFREFAWGNRLKAQADDGAYYYTTSSRHNADNHCLVSHRSGRVFRGSDSGLLVKDKNINNHEWTNINGPMGNQLHYSIKVNEFGDQTMLGNTQDVDAQTYRYGRWGNWRGYEGTEAFINPYAGTCHFSGSGGGDLEGVTMSSWYEGYTMADVTTGYWYLIHNPNDNTRSFFRIEGFGRKTTNLSENTRDDSGAGAGARDFALTRDGNRPTLFVLNTNNTLVRSVDNGDTFETVYVKNASGNPVPAKFTGAWIAADPTNADIIYFGQKGKVLCYDLTTGLAENLSEGLPDVACDDLIFHEGSGDLYFFSASGGLYLRSRDTGKWTLWMRGYNPLQAKRVALNHTTQEMVLADYGRGVWVADLEHPADRYFQDGFALKELSHTGERRTIGIDTPWTIPMYYDYTWSINGQETECPSQYLTARLEPGDRVELKLTLRESPDVQTRSAVFTVGETADAGCATRPGTALASDGSGRIDLGYTDCFYNDFTIDLWVRPESDGVILANRPVAVERDTRGWALLVSGGRLKFRYAPAQLFAKATYDAPETQQADLDGGEVSRGRWTHVAVSMDRDGEAAIYVDGERRDGGQRIVTWATLNSAVNLSLFADGFESLPLRGAVDELKIWNRALGENDIRRAMFSHDIAAGDALVYYNGFNAGKLEHERERFAQTGMRPRTEAVTAYETMPVAVGASSAEVKAVEGRTAFGTEGGTALWITPGDGQPAEAGVYRYDGLRPDSMGMDGRFYQAASDIFQIRPGNTSDERLLRLELPAERKEGRQYRLYGCGLYDEQKTWRKIADLKPGEDPELLTADSVAAGQIRDRILAVLENKPAVEAAVEGASESNEIRIYDDTENTFAVVGRLVGGLDEPEGIYELTARNGLLRVSDNMRFVRGEARAQVRINMESIRETGSATDTLESRAGNMVPLAVRVVNCMLPKVSGRALVCNAGGAALADTKLAEHLNGSDRLTLMGWVRLDHADMLKGVKPLIFFRGSNGAVCGLHLADGNVRLHWNDGYYGWKSALNVTADDLGRWMHVAMVAEPTGFRLYLNGAEQVHKTTTPKAKIATALMIGQNYAGDKWFKGAADQVMVWDRALTDSEVRHYMMHNPRLDDEHLMALIDMDCTDADGNILDRVSGTVLKRYGNTTAETCSHLPYTPQEVYTQSGNTPDDGRPAAIEAPQETVAGWLFSRHNGTPYNYIGLEHAELTPLTGEYFVLTADKQQPFGDGQTATVLIDGSSLEPDTDGVVLAVRPSGSSEPFARTVPLTAIEKGRMRFDLDATWLNGGTEMMLLRDATQGELPVRAEITAPGYQTGDTLLLDEATDRIVLKCRILSKNPDSRICVAVVEKEYAEAEHTELDNTLAEQDIAIRIRRDALHPLRLNPLTVVLAGVSEPTGLKLNVAFEPVVSLSLADGGERTDMTATSSHPTLNVRAELIQGVWNQGVEIGVSVWPETTSSTVSTAMGNWTDNNAVDYGSGLLAYAEAQSEADAGWNLMGNPYLADINLTRANNVELDEQEIVKYLYQYNAATDTYTAWDMVDNYDETQRILPMEPFFVQTRREGASMQIKPGARERDMNRRVFAHYMLRQSRTLRLGLFAGADTVAADRTEIKITEGADRGFVVGEDAQKMWGGLNGRAHELATEADGHFLAVNVLPDGQTEIPLIVRPGQAGDYRMGCLRTAGFGLYDKVMLVDRKTGREWNLLDNETATFSTDCSSEDERRFAVRINLYEETTGTGSAPEAERPMVRVEGATFRIENPGGQAAVVEIFDAAGRRTVHTTLPAGGQLEQKLRTGIYIVRVRTANKDYSTKINVRQA